MTPAMEHLHAYLHLEQYLKDLKAELGEDAMLEFLALALEQISTKTPKIQRVV